MTFDDAFALADKIPGWFSVYDFRGLYDLILAAPPGPILEVGSFLGRSAVFISCFRPVVCIDPWLLGPWFRRKLGGDLPGVDLTGDDFSFLFREYAIDNNPFGHRVTPIKARDSQVWGSWSHGPVGLFHLDHEHTEAAVYESLLGWRPHLTRDARIYVHDTQIEGVRKGLRRAGVLTLKVVEDSLAKPAVCVWPKLYT